MTKRKSVSEIKNIWFDSEAVDDADFTVEQTYNDTIQSGIVNNHIGQGVLLESLNQNILFDSLLVSGMLDGLNIQVQNQPSDANLGNQLEIELKDSLTSGKRNVKLGVIGLDFEGNLQYERFVFKKNEILISKKHFTKILMLLFNDFVGQTPKSFNLGGRVLIKEAKPFSLSRDTISVSQDVQPNLFFRDFYVDTAVTLNGLLSSSLPYYNIDNLNIKTSSLGNYSLISGDVTSQIGQKFQATVNNIQKLSLLLSVENTVAGSETDLAWTGDIVISIYELQTSVDCPTDISPNLDIEFSPSPTPLAQVSENYNSLFNRGVILDSVPQPIDFVFSNTSIASGNIIVPGKYYAVSIKRSGAADKCNILVEYGTAQNENGRISLFSGGAWTDIPTEELWYQVWSDSAKISDGQAYENGYGIIIPKIKEDIYGVNKDYTLNEFSFSNNDIYRAVVSSITEQTTPVQDQRTGNPVNSRQQYVPQVELLNTIDFSNLNSAVEPFVVGVISDKNKKTFDATDLVISTNLRNYAIVKDQILFRIYDDPEDPRYDESISGLISNLLNGDLVGAKIVPNTNNPGNYYRIAGAGLCSLIAGDVNGDGLIDNNDLSELNTLLNGNIKVSPDYNTSITTDGYTTTYSNGYTTLIVPFSTEFALTYQLINSSGSVVLNGTDGVLVQDPNDGSLAQFSSASSTFTSITGISDYTLVVFSSNAANKGGFIINAIDNATDVLTIKKLIYTPELFKKIMKADLDGDGYISANDGYILSNYINKLPFQPGFVYPFPGSDPYNKIGKPFNVLSLRIEKFVDRADDYTSSANRNTDLHPVQDLILDDGYFRSHNFLNNPVAVSITKQLVWEEQLVVYNSLPKAVPSVFTYQEGFNKFDCLRGELDCSGYPTLLPFDQGRVDYYVPNNLVIGDGGELTRPDGYFYKVDFEVGTIVLEIPDAIFGSEKTINLLDDFIANYNGNGLTRVGFPAMKFADCSYVETDALIKDQLRFSVSVQSFSPNLNGLDVDGYEGAIVDGKIGVSIDYTSGLLTLNFSNLYQDPTLPTLTTKIQVHVFLKKGGFNNQTLFVDSAKMQNMLKLVSVFSGANSGGSSLVELGSDVQGILPILHGGTGLNSVGAAGTVLVSNGGSLSYQFIYDIPGLFISSSTGIANANTAVKTDGYGLLDPSLYYKNPVYIDGYMGVATYGSTSPIDLAAFTFRFDKYILQGIQDIKLEAILESTSVGSSAEILLYNNNTASYITLISMSTTNPTSTLIRSQDLKTLLSSGATDYIYKIRFRYTPGGGGNTGTCRMVRLVITYSNPASAPPTGNSYNFVPFAP